MSDTSTKLPFRSVSFAGLLIILSATLGFAQTVYEQLEFRSPLPTPNHLTNLQYGNGKFLAATERAGIILSSDDGITWESHKTGWRGSINDLAYGNGLYCAVSSGSGSVFFSSDLTNWTEVLSNSFPSNNDNVYFHNGLFYFGGNQFGDSAGIVTTPDGVNFTEVPTPGEDEIRDMVFANNQFVAVGDGLEIMTSPNGVNWTLRPTGLVIENFGDGLLNIRYVNSLYVVGGINGTILTSPDGITWTKRDFAEDNSWFWDCWHDGTSYYFPGRQGKLWKTTDFSSWTAYVLDTNEDLYNIVNQENITVVTGRGGNIFTSTDQENWTNRKTGFTQSFSGLAYGAGLFMASDYDGKVIKSSDGITWDISFTPGINITWQTIVFEDGKFVAMSSAGEWILRPADVDIWSLPSVGFDGFPSVSSLRYLNGDWYVTGRDGFLRSSSNLTNWSTHDQVTTNDLRDTAFGDDVFVAVGEGGAIYSSADGSTWVERTSTTTNYLNYVAYGNGKFVALGASGTALTSIDGVTWSSGNQVNQPFNAQDLVFREGQFVALDTSGRVSISSDGLSWTTIQVPISQNLRATAVNDEILVAVGNDGLIMSADLPPPKNLVVNKVGNGQVTIDPDASPYADQSKVTLTASADPDYAFSNWSGDATGNTNPLVVTMDSDKTITANFVLAVSGFRLWVYQEFTEEERSDEDFSGAQADPDKDGLTNFEEYLRGSNPNEPNSEKGIELDTVDIADVTYLVIRYDRDRGVSGVTQRVEVGDDLVNWESGPTYTEIYQVDNNGDGTETVTVRILDPLVNLTSWFIRLVLEQT
jgi:photosystem II stability/assembly factor-like uncharacterized protein